MTSIFGGTMVYALRAAPDVTVIGAGAEALAHAIGGTQGVVIDLIILAAVAGVIYWRSRGTKVDHNNVNDEWTGSVAPEPEPAAAA
jgi:inorganic phosphate transporter, PiT family